MDLNTTIYFSDSDDESMDNAEWLMKYTSLAPLIIAQSLKMKIDRSHLISVQGADGKKLSVIGTSFVYMKDSACP